MNFKFSFLENLENSEKDLSLLRDQVVILFSLGLENLVNCDLEGFIFVFAHFVPRIIILHYFLDLKLRVAIIVDGLEHVQCELVIFKREIFSVGNFHIKREPFVFD